MPVMEMAAADTLRALLYLRVMEMERESSTTNTSWFSPTKEEAFLELSCWLDMYDILY